MRKKKRNLPFLVTRYLLCRFTMKFPFTRVTVTHFFSGNPSWGSFNKFWHRTKITYWEEALYTQVFRLL